jgi:hypothetical protein
VWIPRNITSVGDYAEDPWWDRSLPMDSIFMETAHDPLYNSIGRPALDVILDIAPATPQMEEWEERGYNYGYCAGGDCNYWDHESLDTTVHVPLAKDAW